MKTTQKAFTLLEILLVIAMIGILAAIVIVAINPQRQLSQARNAKRRSDILTIQKALDQYLIDNGTYPTVLTSNYQEVCAVTGPDCQGTISIESLQPNYIAFLPQDPQAIGGRTGYEVAINIENGKVSVRSSQAELSETIIINPITALVVNNLGAVIRGAGDKRMTHMAVDYAGNRYVAGTYTGTLFVPTIGSFANAGNADIFLIKYNINQEPQWVQTVGGTGNEDIGGIDVDSSGNIWLFGEFRNSITIGTLGTLVSAGQSDMFLAQYSPLGNPLQVQRFGSTGTNLARGIVIDSNDNKYITGKFAGTVDFGSGPITSTNSQQQIFTAKLNADMSVGWLSQTIASVMADSVISIAKDSADNIYIGGQLYELINFGSGYSLSIGNTNRAGYIAKYNGNGQIQSLTQVGWKVNDIEINSVGEIFVAGEYIGTWNTGNAGSVTSNGINEGFVIKYNPQFQSQWVQSIGSTDSDAALSLSLDSQSNVYMVGRSYNPTTLNFGSAGTYTAIPNAHQEGFIVKYNTLGVSQWYQVGIGAAFRDSVASTIAIDRSDNIHFGGYFQESTTFGVVGPLISTDATNHRASFIATYSRDQY